MKKITIEKVDKENVPIDLLLLADPSREAIETYLGKGSCFVARENENIIGAYVLVKKGKEEMEIMNIAVVEKYQNKGIGKLLISDAVVKAKKEGGKKLIVGTGNSSISQIAFYQKCGFRITGIKKDYFTRRYNQPIHENGIICKDMIMLEMIIG